MFRFVCASSMRETKYTNQKLRHTSQSGNRAWMSKERDGQRWKLNVALINFEGSTHHFHQRLEDANWVIELSCRFAWLLSLVGNWIVFGSSYRYANGINGHLPRWVMPIILSMWVCEPKSCGNRETIPIHQIIEEMNKFWAESEMLAGFHFVIASVLSNSISLYLHLSFSILLCGNQKYRYHKKMTTSSIFFGPKNSSSISLQSK